MIKGSFSKFLFLFLVLAVAFVGCKQSSGGGAGGVGGGKPAAPSVVVDGNRSIKVGTEVELIATATMGKNDSGNFSYAWYKSNTNDTSGEVISGETGKTFTPDTSNVGTSYYYCKVKSSGSGLTALSNIVYVQVFDAAKPAISISATGYNENSIKIEPNNSITFVADARLGENDTGNLSVQWKINGTDISGATETSYTKNFSADGEFVISCVAKSDSNAEYVTESNQISVIVETPADGDFGFDFN